jgi:hypothetical protein
MTTPTSDPISITYAPALTEIGRWSAVGKVPVRGIVLAPVRL